MPQPMHEGDVRTMVRLIAEVAASNTDSPAAKRHLMNRLQRLIDADGWVCGSAFFPSGDSLVSPSGSRLIVSIRKVDGDKLSLLALYRLAGRPAFTERERRIAEILLTEVRWLHARDWPEKGRKRVAALSPRRQLVLDRLLEGASRKGIANDLGLSLYTVSDYIKDIYQVFGVRSHAELIRRFSRGGDDEDTFSPASHPASAAHAKTVQRV